MAPRNFSEDGAVGAGSYSGGGNNGDSIGGVQVNDPGSPPGGISDPDLTGASNWQSDSQNIINDKNTQWDTGSQAMGDYTNSQVNPTDPSAMGIFEANAPGGPRFHKYTSAESAEANAWETGLANGPQTSLMGGSGFNFAAGGAVPDGDEDDQGDGTPDQESNQGLASVKGVMDYLYEQYGVGDKAQEQKGIEEADASRMPSRPGDQSESGRPPLQPMPGPLPPTSNPFGQRKQYSANMPARPPGQSESGIPPLQPAPGRLPPTSNPFGKRMAANMPARPPGQSETGIPPLQPAPGRLPPTDNPFGKRADEGIDTDEDVG